MTSIEVKISLQDFIQKFKTDQICEEVSYGSGPSTSISRIEADCRCICYIMHNSIFVIDAERDSFKVMFELEYAVLFSVIPYTDDFERYIVYFKDKSFLSFFVKKQ